ncbi:MAG TPA: outer membrane beta-barrel protein [Candidatus Binatus sp.]|nr:outer membrane beta-barrel protein [Candidatus Binatus sp.]
MIRKFATVPRLRVALGLILATILAGATTVHAQQPSTQQPPTQQPADQPAAQQPTAPAQQQPATQPTGVQEASPEDLGPSHKIKVKDYKNWTFNAGGGASLTNGNTENFVRGGGGVVAAGVARNTSKYFGLRLDFQWDNLPLRDRALFLAQAPGANSHVYSLSLDPIINIPATPTWGGYILGGPSYYHRSGKLDSSTAIPGSACNPFFAWWGSCSSVSLPISGGFLKSSQNEFGENFGFGLTHKISDRFELYAEFRDLHGKNGTVTTDLRPITIGVRW